MAHKKKGSKKGSSAANGPSRPQTAAAQTNGEPHSYKEAVTTNLDINATGMLRDIDGLLPTVQPAKGLNKLILSERTMMSLIEWRAIIFEINLTVAILHS